MLSFKKGTCIAKYLLMILGLFVAFIVPFQRVLAAKGEPSDNKVAKVKEYQLKVKAELDTDYIGVFDRYGDVASIHEFFGNDSLYRIAYSDKENVYIHILNQNMVEQKIITIKKQLDLVGNVSMDQMGNYYIVYGQYDSTDMNADLMAGTKVVISIVKYASDGSFSEKVDYTGLETCPYKGIGWGTKEPFNFGNCTVIIDAQGTLVCRYGRVMYNGHQSSHTIYVDTSTMTKRNIAAPYNSHSFDQRVIETSDGGYLFADRGDGYGRGFVINKITKSTTNIYNTISFIPFHFRNGYIYQETYAALAGIAEMRNGYALVGTSEKTLSYDTAKGEYFNESRNIMMQVFQKNFNNKSSNLEYVQLLDGEKRTAIGTYRNEVGGCEANAADYGVKWLTNYSGNYYAGNPKLIQISEERLLIMWEKMQYEKEEYYNKFISSYYMIVSSSGEIIQPETKIESRLPVYGQPVYKDNSVYWTTSRGENVPETFLHQLFIGEYMNAKIPVEKLTTASHISVSIGETVKINYNIFPTNATNQRVLYTTDDTVITIDEDGNLKGMMLGYTGFYITSSDNSELSEYVEVTVTDTAPTNVKAIQESVTNDGKIKLSWSKSKLNKSYQIYRADTKDGWYLWIGETNTLSYYDTEVTPGNTYYYQIKAGDFDWDTNDTASYSDTVKVYVMKSPTKFLGTSTKSTVSLSWNKVSSASGYELYRYDTATKKYKLVKTITNASTVSFTVKGLKKGSTYSYKIRAFKTINKEKSYSNYSSVLKVKVK